MSLSAALHHRESLHSVFPQHADLRPRRTRRAVVLDAPSALPGVHRVDVSLQKPFDHETGALYDPDLSRRAD
ncbi:hypothetical protein GCM10007860_32790 [Chitiniphilus shinanonensis]|uniref:Uncharacterized protein n=1 Tax=Chitiniphilus shinanonensis TaxID=553088 RepID=A0ABQ6BVX4_9NEIS|nr:hypothetical protein [Chitiniphilus shinanonensis]GLS06113.1 hypothetical protein GCM10007860_32790 [Chitiniphilus shinanonensis]